MFSPMTMSVLQVSYDDGESWQAVPLTGRTGHWTGHLSYPDNASRFVSLRARAWDSKGNTSKVTIQNVFQSNGVIHVVDTVLLPS